MQVVSDQLRRPFQNAQLGREASQGPIQNQRSGTRKKAKTTARSNEIRTSTEVTGGRELGAAVAATTFPFRVAPLGGFAARGLVGSTSGTPNLAARLLRASSSASSWADVGTASATAGAGGAADALGSGADGADRLVSLGFTGDAYNRMSEKVKETLSDVWRVRAW